MATKTPLLFLLIAALCVAAESLSTNETISDRIVGGSLTTIEDRPYMVALLQRDGSYFCSGSLITVRHVLTAAHCLEQLAPSQVVALANTTDRRQRGVRRNFVRFFVHPNYNPKTVNFDVAVGKLQRSIRAAHARPFPLCNHALTVGSRLQVSGWGTIGENISDAELRLRTISLPVVRRTWCSQQYSSINRITPAMVCVGGKGGKGVCFGDSGGPGLSRGQICGIVSWGGGCAQRGLPQIVTNLQNPSVKQFIRRSMRR